MSGVVWAVIKREYLQRVRSRWFIAATLAGPLLLVGLMAVPILMASNEEARNNDLTVVDRTGALYDGLAPRLEEVGYTVSRGATDAEALPALTQRVTDGEIGGFLVLDEETLTRGTISMAARETPSLVRRALLQQVVVQTALEVRLGGASADVEALLSGGALEVEVLTTEGLKADDPTFLLAYLGAFILYMTLILYAVAVMRSVLEEKTSRIVEVVISSMRPFQLMLGKILGVGAVGLTQFAIWVVSAVVIFSTGLPALVASRPDIPAEFLAEAVPSLGYAGLFLIYFLGGYFIYSGLYAAVGAMCNTDEEAQQAQFPVIMLLVVPIVFVTGVIQDPTAPWSVTLSFIPFFTPILMFARAVVGGATGIEVALSVVLMVLTILAVAWVAGRIYRVGILMAGKRPTLPEIIRWVREA